jgi:four helix bundle protein
MQDFRKLGIWKKSHLLTLDVYKITSKFPKEEQYGLTSQIRRSCVSLSSNIVEGCGREGKTEFQRFLQISMGSLYELEYQLLLAHDLGFMDLPTYDGFNDKVNEIRKMMLSFVIKLKSAA